METIRLYDVTPRDGLQNEPDIVATEDNVEPVVATYTEEDGWLPPRSEQDLAEFTESGRDQHFVDAAVESALNRLPPGKPGGTGV